MKVIVIFRKKLRYIRHENIFFNLLYDDEIVKKTE